MRILLVTHYFAPEEGAPQRRWSELVARFVAVGHEVHVICPPPHYPSGRLRAEHRSLRAGSSGSHRGATVHRVSFLAHRGGIAGRSLDHLWTAAATVIRHRRLASGQDQRFDVVIATAPALESLLAGHIISRLLDRPLIAEMRDAWPDLVSHTPGLTSPSGPTGLVKRAVHRGVTRLQRRAAAVVTTTSAFGEVLRDRGLPHVAVIRNGTEVSRFAFISKDIRSSCQLNILYLGTVGRSQGLDVVVRAAALAQARGFDVKVRIVGPGADMTRLRRLNASLGAPVDLQDEISGSEVARMYEWADSVIVSLRDWEPFSWTVPSKLYELLALGKHITAVVAGEAAQIVRACKAGDVVPPGDVEALASVWADLAVDRARLAVGSGGIQWALEHSGFDGIAREYLGLIQAVEREAARAE